MSITGAPTEILK